MTALVVTSDLTYEEACARLSVDQRPCELCVEEVDSLGIASGHVAAGHPAPRRVVHCQLGSFGADWDEDVVHAFLAQAEAIIRVPEGHWLARDHAVAALGRYDATSPRKWYCFATVPA